MNHPALLAKFRHALRSAPRDQLQMLLDDIAGQLPPDRLEDAARRLFTLPADTASPPDATPDTPDTLLADIRAFEAASLAGEFFDEALPARPAALTGGTVAWIAECERLVARCIARSADEHGAKQVLASFDRLFALLDTAFDCAHEILYLVDDEGSECLGIDWPTVATSWLACLERAHPTAPERQTQLRAWIDGTPTGVVAPHLAAALRLRR